MCWNSYLSSSYFFFRIWGPQVNSKFFSTNTGIMLTFWEFFCYVLKVSIFFFLDRKLTYEKSFSNMFSFFKMKEQRSFFFNTTQLITSGLLWEKQYFWVCQSISVTSWKQWQQKKMEEDEGSGVWEEREEGKEREDNKRKEKKGKGKKGSNERM